MISQRITKYTYIHNIGVGTSSQQRRIVNLAAGTANTDAVNLQQLQAAIASVGGGASGDRVAAKATIRVDFQAREAGTIPGSRRAATSASVATTMLRAESLSPPASVTAPGAIDSTRVPRRSEPEGSVAAS